MWIIIFLLFNLFLISGCDLNQPIRMLSTKNSFKFSKDYSGKSVVAFSILCSGIKFREINSRFIDIKSNKEFFFGFPCDYENARPQIATYILPAGEYKLGEISYTNGNKVYWSKGDHFYFTIQPHKVNYLGRLSVEIYKAAIRTTINNESIKDLPQIKIALPNVSLTDYRELIWEKNWLGDAVGNYLNAELDA